jgi:hypothetical protein
MNSEQYTGIAEGGSDIIGRCPPFVGFSIAGGAATRPRLTMNPTQISCDDWSETRTRRLHPACIILRSRIGVWRVFHSPRPSRLKHRIDTPAPTLGETPQTTDTLEGKATLNGTARPPRRSPCPARGRSGTCSPVQPMPGRACTWARMAPPFPVETLTASTGPI